MTRSDARERPVPPTGPHAPAAGAEGGELSEAGREALIDWWDSDWPDTKGGALGTLYAAVERILAARRPADAPKSKRIDSTLPPLHGGYRAAPGESRSGPPRPPKGEGGGSKAARPADEDGDYSDLIEKWTAASRAARKAQHHFPADCLAEAVEVVQRLAARPADEGGLLCGQCGERPAAMVKVGAQDGWCTVCLDEAAEPTDEPTRAGLRADIEALVNEPDDEQEWEHPDGNSWRRVQVIDSERIRAILARHPAEPSTPTPEVTVIEEWGVRYADGITVEESRSARQVLARLRHNAYLPGISKWAAAQCDAALVRRTRTRYADHVTEWEEVDD